MTKAQTATITKKQTRHSSLFTKCTAPFISKQHSHVEQEIRLDEPFRQYQPGNSVKGAIRLNVAKPVRITHLTLRLHGFVKVINRAKSPGEDIQYDEKLFAAGSGKGRRGIEYFGNGFAQLFDEEVVLCGEGCVSGKYEFRFELALPSKGMPSSINFEHGTISYLLSSTVTRPTAIAPKSTKHCKLNVQEIIDIAPIPKPRPQKISLEALNKKRKSRMGRKNQNLFRTDHNIDSMDGLHSPTYISVQIEDDPPRSPVPSEISSASLTGSSTSSDQTGTRTPPWSTLNGATQSSLSQEIAASATTELLQGGCMAGETIPIRVSVQHVKHVKNMQGIIITLFRQGRIDTHPAIPLGPCRRGKKVEYEDYYPKSRTGLGGLSLSSAGSSRSFRQDLNQIFAPIIVDPHTHTHVVNTSISVPVDSFPTVSCVPGAMISFNYYIEIVVDLRTKVGSQDRIRPHLSMTSAQQHSYGDPRISRHEGIDGISYLSTPGYSCLITDQLRRTKGVVFTRTEIIVGTRDSTRNRGKQREERHLGGDGSLGGSIQLGREQDPQDPEFDQERRQSISESQDGQQQAANPVRDQQTIYVPSPPDLEVELDEKERLRRAEQRLLPSAPPQADAPLPSVPTAPPAIDEEDFIRRYGLGPSAPAYEGPSTHYPPHTNNTMPNTASRENTCEPQDDKQELERQRLLALVSAPPAEEMDDEAESSSRGLPPSAPVLYEDDIFDLNDPRIPQAEQDLIPSNDLIPEEQHGHPSPVATATPMQNDSHADHSCHEPVPAGHNDSNDNHLPVYKR